MMATSSLASVPLVHSPTRLRRCADHACRTPAVPAIVGSVLRSPGQALDPQTRGFMEARLRSDFSRVRLHSGLTAEESARAVGAAAYTVGSNVVLGSGVSPSTSSGRRTLAHELVHVMQNGGSQSLAALELGATNDPSEAEAESLASSALSGGGATRSMREPPIKSVVRRTPHKSGVASGDYSYSTNCGWIDWGHANPKMAQGLIDQVRAASARLHAEEATRSVEPGAASPTPKPGKPTPGACPAHYEPNEKAESSAATEPLVDSHAFTDYQEAYLYGFEVDSPDASRFASALKTLDLLTRASPQTRFEVYGFTDCIGAEKHNLRLRAERALAVQALLPSDVQKRTSTVTFAESGRYLSDNAAREGRRRNRAVVVKILPPLPPERVSSAQTSGIPHLPRAGVNAAALIADILEPLSPDEELRVALAIFTNTSVAFELSQQATEAAVSSSFSEEDLPSDLLGFYRAARGLSRADVEKTCDAWDPPRSLAKLQGYTFVKNWYFDPPSLPPGGAWPAAFKSIEQETPGKLWELRELIFRMPGVTLRKCFSGGDNVPCK